MSWAIPQYHQLGDRDLPLNIEEFSTLSRLGLPAPLELNLHEYSYSLIKWMPLVSVRSCVAFPRRAGLERTGLKCWREEKKKRLDDILCWPDGRDTQSPPLPSERAEQSLWRRTGPCLAKITLIG